MSHVDPKYLAELLLHLHKGEGVQHFDVGGTVFGTGSTPGLLGTGQFQTDPTKFAMPNFQGYQDQAGGQSSAASGYANPGAQGAPGSQQSVLASMLMKQAAGLGGPSPADLELQRGTDNNIRQAMALGQSMPGQSNMAAMRNIEDNTSRAQQDAVNQAAILRANEQMAAEGQAANVLGQERGQDLTNTNQENNTALGWAGLGQQGANDQLQANIAQQQIQQGAYQNAANANSKVAGGVLSGIGAAFGLAHGGEAPDSEDMVGGPEYSKWKKYAAGGGVGLGYFGLSPNQPTQDNSNPFDLSSIIKKNAGTPSVDYSSTTGGTGADMSGSSDFVSGLANQHLGPLPEYKGGPISFLLGGGVPGRAEEEGDHAENDTVPAVLSPGEIVLPRSVTQSPDAEELAKQFVAEIKAKKTAKRAASRK